MDFRVDLLQKREFFFRLISIVLTLITLSHLVAGNNIIAILAFTLLIIIIPACFHTRFPKKYELLTRILYLFILTYVIVFTLLTGFISSPTIIWALGLGIISPFIFSRRFSLGIVTIVLLSLVLNLVLYLTKVQIPVTIQVKDPNIFRFIAYFLNGSFIFYLSIQYIKNYEQAISKIKKAESFNDILYNVFDATEDYIGVASPEVGIVFHNRAFVEIPEKTQRLKNLILPISTLKTFMKRH